MCLKVNPPSSSPNHSQQGSGDACPSAPELYRLNWATALATLDSTSFRAAVPVTHTLLPTSTQERNMVVLRMDWTSPWRYNLYFSTRQRVSGGQGTNSGPRTK